MIWWTVSRSSGPGTTISMPWRSIRSAQNGSSMVNRVPRRPTRRIPAAETAAATLSTMCTRGMSTAASIASATLCMVFVHSTRISAPAPSSAWAALASRAPASSHDPATCSSSISAKSTDHNSSGAECRPPRRARVSSFANR